MTDLLAALLGSVNDAVFVLDGSGRVRAANPAGARLVGRESRDLLGVDFHDTVHGCGLDGGGGDPRAECPLARSRRLGESVRLEDEALVRADGAVVPVALVGTPLGENGGGGWLAVASDRSAAVALEERAATGRRCALPGHPHPPRPERGPVRAPRAAGAGPHLGRRRPARAAAADGDARRRAGPARRLPAGGRGARPGARDRRLGDPPGRGARRGRPPRAVQPLRGVPRRRRPRHGRGGRTDGGGRRPAAMS